MKVELDPDDLDAGPEPEDATPAGGPRGVFRRSWGRLAALAARWWDRELLAELRFRLSEQAAAYEAKLAEAKLKLVAAEAVRDAAVIERDVATAMVHRVAAMVRADTIAHNATAATLKNRSGEAGGPGPDE